MTRVNGFAAEGQSSSDQQQHFRRALLWSLGKSLLIPLLVLGFFLVAPVWLNHKLHIEVAGSIQTDDKLSAAEKADSLERLKKIDFAKVCDECPPELQKVRDWLDEADVTPVFQRLRWGQYLSYLLLAILGSTVAALLVLNSRAKRSTEDLIFTYQLSWRLSMAAALAKVLLLIPLLGYGFFEFTVLISNHYFPKLLFLIVVGGLIALWKCTSILLSTIPLEFNESMARSVSEQEAPELWRVIRASAERLHTAPPDHILIGMQLNFYVTELAVKHDSGRAAGRTLYLSYPLLKMLAPDEVTAIIGHELGHFIGRDTRMTREFYPMKYKIHGTMMTLAQSGWAAWPSLEFLSFFNGCFEQTVQAASRQRELLADQAGAQLTSPQIQARALVRLHIMLEAFNRGITENLKLNVPNPLDVPVHSVIQSQLLKESAFWSKLFDQELPHPLDSHPSLQVRLAGLGQAYDTVAAQHLAAEEIASAYALWLPNHEHLFTDLTQQAHEALGKARAQKEVVTADLSSETGRALLNQHFPTKAWTIRPYAFWMPIVMGTVITLLLVTIAWFIYDLKAALLMGGGALLSGLYATSHWIRHRHGRLTVNAAGLSYTGWTRPILFEEVAGVSFPNINDSLKMTIDFKKKQSSIWKFSLTPWQTGKATLTLSSLDGEPVDIARTLYRYYARELDDAAAEAIV